MNPTLTYFTQQGPISDPGTHVSLFDNLPTSIPELVKLVQGVTIHVFWMERYGFKAPPERMAELQLRTMEKRLARTLELDPRPLTEPRPIEKKLLGNCRDHSLLLVSMLRHQGIPARARCGFAAYFMPDHFEDHWVVEYWNAEQNRWALVDAQLDALQQDVLKTNFDVLDVPRDQFIVGGKAWQMCRAGEQDPDKFGIFDMHGLGFVRGDFVRDVASLNKMELLPWDCWGVILNESLDNPVDLAALDEVAALTANDVPDFETVRTRYESDPRLHMNGKLLSYVNGGMVEVNIP
ncbi:transglutaminase-like domain-containing protein [Candidatus Villigracilis affinis]|uniref:transglutaminase-like domain-containing protein n=1 Tax=Candidatus Villigracilis affinis TaxID=3140682 RepID=UPI002A1AF671|nr:transglutaminase domain-containing protein [Anaerolineales bacterium]